MRNWRDVSYLARGTPRQQLAYRAVIGLGIFEKLKQYDAVLVSTICVGIDIAESDLDVICCFEDADAFERILRAWFGLEENFQIRRSGTAFSERVVAEFEYGGFQFEVFGCVEPVEQQNAYRHLSAAARVVSLGGAGLREKIRGLKAAGLKTEPTIASVLKLEGDPYQAVLRLEALTDAELAEIVGGY